jgi:DNA polymerase III subunit epsilon
MGVWGRLFGRRRDESSTPTSQKPTSAAPRDRRVPAYAVIDVETTGLSPSRDRIVELAIVRVDDRGAAVDEFTVRFNPEGPVGATHIHGITDADVVHAPLFREVAPKVVATLRGLPIVAHNAKFDLAFLREELNGAGWNVPWLAAYCTLDASYLHLPDMDRRRLADCCWAVGQPIVDAHSALGDARAAAGLLRVYLGTGVDNMLRTVRADAAGVVWPAGPARAPMTAADRIARSPLRPRPIRITPPRLQQPPLLQQLTALSLTEVLDEGAPDGTAAYLELLLDALEDGDISDAEATALTELREGYGLTAAELNRAHEAFMLALAHRALDDGHVSRDERRELADIAALLSTPQALVKTVLDRADAARNNRLAANLSPLPSGWTHGEPLRVGDKVAFTGCDEKQRAELEQRATSLGVRVMNNVSKFTVMLVMDGSFSGGKHARALELGTRTEHPDVFAELLQYLQPAAPHADRLAPARPATGRAAVPKSPPVGVTASRGQGAAPSVVRAWAVANGFPVGVRGRLPDDVLVAYAADH